MKRNSIVLIGLLASSLFAGVLRGEGLAVSLEAFKVTLDQAGAESLVLADTAEPGAVIEYRAICKNPTEAALGNVSTEVPVPEGLVWVASSDKPKASAARLADGRVVALPAVDAEGRPLPVEQIRALRWQVESVPAGEAITLSLRASVGR